MSGMRPWGRAHRHPILRSNVVQYHHRATPSPLQNSTWHQQQPPLICSANFWHSVVTFSSTGVGLVPVSRWRPAEAGDRERGQEGQRQRGREEEAQGVGEGCIRRAHNGKQGRGSWPPAPCFQGSQEGLELEVREAKATLPSCLPGPSSYLAEVPVLLCSAPGPAAGR